MATNLNLHLLQDRLAVCRLSPGEAVTEWALSGAGLRSVTRAPGELSVVCAEAAVPEGVKREPGWRAFQVEGPLAFSLTGVLASIAAPLAEAGVPIFALSTFDTDYVLVKEEHVPRAVEALERAGHRVAGG
jgi:hypothetical protein